MDQQTKDVFIEDNGFGGLSLFTLVNETKNVVLQEAGIVDYANGIVKLNQVQVLPPVDDPYIKIFATAQNQRYTSIRDMILFCDYAEDTSAITVFVNGVAETGSLVTSN